MTFSTDEAVTAVAAPAPAGLHFTPFPPTKGAARDCKKLAAMHVDRAAPGSIVGGSLFETMKASSPRRAADAEHGDWMVPRFPTANIYSFPGARSIDPRLTFLFLFPCAGEAPVGIDAVRGGARRGEGEADRDVPGLRRHPVADRRGPRPRRHVRGGQQFFLVFLLDDAEDSFFIVKFLWY